MLAVVKTGGKQVRVQPGDVVQVERLVGNAGDDVVFDAVLLVEKDDGSVEIGSPLIEQASVKGEIVEQKRGRKIVVFKFKRRQGYRKKMGHRQYYTSVRITDISV